MKKDGFTLIELLIVIVVMALLLAVAVPSMIAAKKRAFSVQCSSNLRQLSLGFMIYLHEHEAFPYGFCDDQLGQSIPPEGYAGSPMYDKQGLWWFNYLQSVIEFDQGSGSILWCPARKLTGRKVQHNILCGNYGVNRSVCRDAQGKDLSMFSGDPVRSTHLRTPAATLLIGDSGYSLFSWLAATNTSSPVFENLHRTKYFYIPGLKLNQSRLKLQDNSDAIKGRHPHQKLNIGFADGHNELWNADSLMIEPPATDSTKLPSLWSP